MDVIRPIIMGPSAISWGTSVGLKVSPLDRGKGRPAGSVEVRLGTMTTGPTF